MTTVTAPTASDSGRTSAGNGRPDTAGGGIDRVNAFDGLFLRAEHLTVMQDYALALAEAVGQAGGPGVVHGFGVTLVGHQVKIAPGLAVDPHGRPLRSSRVLTLDLPDTLADNQFYWVQISSSLWTYGSEAVQGLLCDDPCSGGSTADGRRAEGVVGGLGIGAEQGLFTIASERKRGWLASRLFARERSQSPPSLDPGDPTAWPTADNPTLQGQDWQPPPAPESVSDYIRLAVVIPDPELGWQLDVWTARRDRGAPTPVRAWQTRLAMRPWDVFVAQILQFQALLGDKVLSAEALEGRAYVEEVVRRMQQVKELLGTRTPKRASEAQLELLSQELRSGSLGDRLDKSAGRHTLPDVGIDELPPAGFLPLTGRKRIADEVTASLGGRTSVDVRLCTGSLGDVGGFLEPAQHRDRIRLGGSKQPEPVDVLVVSDPSFDWVAFRRRETTSCGDESSVSTEPVDVYVITEEEDKELYAEWSSYVLNDGSADVPDLPKDPVATLQYPVRTWALPAGTEAVQLTDDLFELVGTERTTAVALVATSDRRALGVARAGLLVTSITVGRSRNAELRADVWTKVPESIVVLAPTPSDIVS
jgi:hypothetical protein